MEVGCLGGLWKGELRDVYCRNVDVLKEKNDLVDVLTMKDCT